MLNLPKKYQTSHLWNVKNINLFPIKAGRSHYIWAAFRVSFWYLLKYENMYKPWTFAMLDFILFEKLHLPNCHYPASTYLFNNHLLREPLCKICIFACKRVWLDLSNCFLMFAYTLLSLTDICSPRHTWLSGSHPIYQSLVKNLPPSAHWNTLMKA